MREELGFTVFEIADECIAVGREHNGLITFVRLLAVYLFEKALIDAHRVFVL